MTSTLNEFATKFRTEELTIVKFDHWTWSVRPVHSTLGAGILSLNRFCTSFGSLSTDEAAELAHANHEIERRLAAKFSPDKFNYIMLMMVDVHLHFHVIPRYKDTVAFAEINWKDNGWPALPALGDGAEYQSHNLLFEVRDTLRVV